MIKAAMTMTNEGKTANPAEKHLSEARTTPKGKTVDQKLSELS